jgi:hypothetical protein
VVPDYADSMLPHLVVNINGNDVPTAVVNGRLVMRGGRVLTADQDRVVQQARTVVDCNWGSRGTAGPSSPGSSTRSQVRASCHACDPAVGATAQ